MGAIFLDKIGNLSNFTVNNTELFEYLPLLGHSLIIGLLLAIASYLTGKQMLNLNGKNYQKKKAQLILASSNILYLCLGLSSVMILVNNNLARAFSIGAAISLVRFRRKLGEKSNDSNILFGIIAGMSCGLGVVTLAWTISLIYVLISTVLAYFTKNTFKEIS